MFTLHDQQAQEEHYARLMEKAQKQRQLRALRPPRRPMRLFQVLMARLGDLLYGWGCRLQTRYGGILDPAPDGGVMPLQNTNLVSETGQNNPGYS